MVNLSALIKQLIAERERINTTIATLQSLNGNGASAPQRSGKRSRFSAAARARISKAQKARWAKVRAKQRRPVAGR
jgi:hypothetical protein